MKNDSIGVEGGQVEKEQPLGLFNITPESTNSIPSFESSPALTNFSNFFNGQPEPLAVTYNNNNNNHTNNDASTFISYSDRLKSPVNLTLCSVLLILVSGLWLVAGYFVQTVTVIYDSPSFLAYLSIISLQIYFLFIPRRPQFPKRRPDGSLIVNESDLAYDTYSNREAFKLAIYLFVLFSISIGLIIKGLSLFPQSSYCGSIALLGGLVLCMMLVLGIRTESITRFKAISIALLTASGVVTLLEPLIWDQIDLSSFVNYGLGLSLVGVFLLAVFFVILTHRIEHSHLSKPLFFGFMGLLSMICLWVVFIPLQVFQLELIAFPPPREDVYWYILGIVLMGTVIPFYVIQWVQSRTSLLFVLVLLGAIVPLHGIAESVYFLEWNWINFVASLLSVSAILLVNYRYK